MRIERWLYTIPLRLRSLFRRQQVEQELDEEFGYHVERKTDQYIAQGLPPEAARRAAMRDMDGIERRKEECRDTRRVNLIRDLVQDARYGLRNLCRAKWISVAAVATLALGIGTNTALFSVVYTVLLRSLPFPDSDRLMIIVQHDPRTGASNDLFAPTTFFDWRAQNHSFQSMSAVVTMQVTFTGRKEPVQLTAQSVSASFLDVLGVPPLLGRTFRPDEDLPNRNNVVLISYALWQNDFGGSQTVVGQTVTVDGFPVTVIGVLPRDFEFLSNLPSLWMPLGRDPNARWTEGRDFRIVARLRSGASVAQAQTDLTTVNQRLERDGPLILTGTNTQVRLQPLIESYVAEVRPALVVLLGAVLCILLIACANVANLLLARATTRKHEMAVRVSLGASRGRLIRQLLTESLVLTSVGGFLGVVVAWLGARFLIRLVPATMPIPRLGQLQPNLTILTFTLGVTVATAFLVGLVPAFQASRQDIAISIRHGGRALGGGRRLRGSLVAIEIALAAVLLISAGLLLRTFAFLRSVDPGFHGRNVLACHMILPYGQYRTGRDQAAFFDRVLERVRSLPGIRSAAAIDNLPVSGAGGGTWIHVEGRPEPPPGQQLNVMVRTVTPGYFATLGVPLYAGRDFTDADTGVLDLSKPIDPKTSRLKVIVNQALIDHFLRGENALGRHLAIFWGQTLVAEIIGVVANVRYQSLAEEAEPTFYWPEGQRPQGLMHLVIRTAGRPADWAGALRAAVQSVDQNVPVADVETLSEVVSLASSRTRFSLVLLGAFAGMALIMAAVGLFGVMAYGVAQRTQEIGVRMALGAKPSGIVAMVLRNGLTLVVIGLATGTLAAIGLTRLIASLLYGVRPLDPLTYMLALGVLLAVATLAAFVPAWRASKIDPILALRWE